MERVIRTAILETLKELRLPEVDFAVEHPGDLTHGDYASNVALVVAKGVGEAPRQVAERLAAALQGQIEYVDRIEIAGPGFINFFLARDFFVEEITRARTLGADWGKNKTRSGETIVVEYTSPNLFKPLHIGNLVGNILGESISRLYEYASADVKRANYPSDIGLTVAKGVWGLQKTGGNPDDINMLGEAYRVGNEAYETDEVAKKEIEAVNQALYAGTDAALSELRTRGLATSRARLQELCAKLGTQFDIEITESEAAPVGMEIVQKNVGDIFTESQGAVVYEGEAVGLHTRVFLNSQGLPTYEAKDIGHFVLKHANYPNWTESLIVTGNEQTEYFKVIFAAIHDLFPETQGRVLIHVPTGFLTLTTGKMSSRKGNVLTGESLLAEMEAAARQKAAETRSDNLTALTEEVAVAALKYQILRQAIGSNIVFDKEKALSFEGDSGPYLQYTHARICSVLEKAKAMGIEPVIVKAPAAPYVVEKTLYQFPEVVERALAERAPHHVAHYLIELAAAFNTFYAEEKIADVADEFAPYKAAIADSVRITLENGLWVLGIKAPERM